jgi:hypothetical protein
MAAPTVLDVFWALAETRAHLAHRGEISLHDAVDGLQEHALSRGVIAEVGQDAVQAIMAEAFRRPPRWSKP